MSAGSRTGVSAFVGGCHEIALMVVSGLRVSGVLDAPRTTSRLTVPGSAVVRRTFDVSRSGCLVGHLGESRVVGWTHACGHDPLPLEP